jgi:hypothetical protein
MKLFWKSSIFHINYIFTEKNELRNQAAEQTWMKDVWLGKYCRFFSFFGKDWSILFQRAVIYYQRQLETYLYFLLYALKKRERETVARNAKNRVTFWAKNIK